VVVAVDTTTIAAAAAAAATTGRHNNNRPTMDIIREAAAAAIEVVATTTMPRRFVPVVVVVVDTMMVVADEVVVADTTMVVVVVVDTTTEVEAVVVVDTVAVRGTGMVDEVAVIIEAVHSDHHLHPEEEEVDCRPIDDARSRPMSWCSTRSMKNGNGWPNDVANVKRANRDLMSLPKTWVCCLRLSHHRRRRWIPMRHRYPCTVPLDKHHHHCRRRHCIPIRPMAMELDQQHRIWDCRCKRVTLDACTWAICHCKLPKNKFSRPFEKPFT
jgi:hypothetical protein